MAGEQSNEPGTNDNAGIGSAKQHSECKTRSPQWIYPLEDDLSFRSEMGFTKPERSSCDSGYASLHTTPTFLLPQPQLNNNSLLDSVIPWEDLLLFETHQPTSSGVEEPVRHESEFAQKDAHQNEAPEMPTHWDCMKSSEYSRPSNRSPTDSPIGEGGTGSDSGGSTESDFSDYTPNASPEDDAWLRMAYAKHRMMVSLMREVYTIFNSQWTVGFRSRTESRGASTGAHSQESSSQTSSSTRKGKRKRDDRNSDPSDHNLMKVKRTNSKTPEDVSQGRLFACCFYKYNKQKYCSNRETGTKYRSCAGPGFATISRLKQHLKRNHPVPIHCPRCWLVMKSQTEMAIHANAEERCEQKAPQVLEGVDSEKMRMVTGTWGISWEGIYEILFPGAPVPSPYYGANDFLPENLEPSSPRSRELQDFENYNRTALPLLVEANLRAIVESQFAPIEEHVRSLVIDLVRTCQSTVARNFHSMIAPSSANDRSESSARTVSLVEAAEQTHAESTQAFEGDIGQSSLDFFCEPPHNSPPSPVPNSKYSSGTGFHDPHSDSGYSSFLHTCICSCHYSSNPWNTTESASSCESCAYMHTDSDDLNAWNLGDCLNQADWNDDGDEPVE